MKIAEIREIPAKDLPLAEKIKEYVTEEDIVLDYIDQCLTIFDTFGKRPHLDDYPEVLKPYLGRTIWTDTINSINSNPDKWEIFVKPVKDKVFTGKLIKKPVILGGIPYCVIILPYKYPFKVHQLFF